MTLKLVQAYKGGKWLAVFKKAIDVPQKLVKS